MAVCTKHGTAYEYKPICIGRRAGLIRRTGAATKRRRGRPRGRIRPSPAHQHASLARVRAFRATAASPLHGDGRGRPHLGRHADGAPDRLLVFMEHAKTRPRRPTMAHDGRQRARAEPHGPTAGGPRAATSYRQLRGVESAGPLVPLRAALRTRRRRVRRCGEHMHANGHGAAIRVGWVARGRPSDGIGSACAASRRSRGATDHASLGHVKACCVSWFGETVREREGCLNAPRVSLSLPRGPVRCSRKRLTWAGSAAAAEEAAEEEAEAKAEVAAAAASSASSS